MKYEGKVFETNTSGKLIVLEYEHNTKVRVKFLDTGYETVVSSGNILKGGVRDPNYPSVYGVGYLGEKYEKGEFKTLMYKRWSSMLQRCYDNKMHRYSPTYVDCHVSGNFSCYSNFKAWSHLQIGNNSLDEQGKPFALDKDILVNGNKLYSEDTCVFVPREINSLLNTHSNRSGVYPLGVHKQYEKFVASISKFGSRVFLGNYSTPEEAFLVYKEDKETYIKEVAEKWRDKIDIRVYDSLMRWVVQ